MISKNILLVEDDENDVFFLQRAFKAAGLVAALAVAQDGREAIDYLSGNGEFSDRKKFPVPDLILLDLKLPKVMGLDVLKWLREQPRFRAAIVIIFTSSRLVPDIERAYQLGINAYLVKPSDPSELAEIASAIKQFWLTLNIRPVTTGKITVAGVAQAEAILVARSQSAQDGTLKFRKEKVP